MHTCRWGLSVWYGSTCSHTICSSMHNIVTFQVENHARSIFTLQFFGVNNTLNFVLCVLCIIFPGPRFMLCWRHYVRNLSISQNELMHIRTFIYIRFVSLKLYYFINGTFITSYTESLLFHDSFADTSEEMLGFKKSKQSWFEAVTQIEGFIISWIIL
jgi:hypothetical protein